MSSNPRSVLPPWIPCAACVLLLASCGSLYYQTQRSIEEANRFIGGMGKPQA